MDLGFDVVCRFKACCGYGFVAHEIPRWCTAICESQFFFLFKCAKSHEAKSGVACVSFRL